MVEQSRKEIEDNLIMIHQALSMLEELEADDVIKVKFETYDNAEYDEELGGEKVMKKEATEQTMAIAIRRRVGRDWVYSRLSELAGYGRQLRAEITRVEREKDTLTEWLNEHTK